MAVIAMAVRRTTARTGWRRLINILKLHLHGIYLSEIAHDFHVLVEYPATHENCLEPIIRDTMSSKPFGEQIREDGALNLPILTGQDGAYPINERPDMIGFFIVRVSHVVTSCRSPCTRHPASDQRFHS